MHPLAPSALGQFDLGSLLEMLPRGMAKHAKLACNVAVWISMFLCLVGYIIVIEDAMMNVLPADTSLSREGVGAIFGLLLIPVCFLPMRCVDPLCHGAPGRSHITPLPGMPAARPPHRLLSITSSLAVAV